MKHREMEKPVAMASGTGAAPARTKPSYNKMSGEKVKSEGVMPSLSSPAAMGTLDVVATKGKGMPSHGMAAAAPVRALKRHVTVPRDAVEGAAGAAPALAADTVRGSTAHFRVSYDPALGADGPTDADALIASCEADYFTLQGYFGMLTPAGLPFDVHITTDNGGAELATQAAPRPASISGAAPERALTFHS